MPKIALVGEAWGEQERIMQRPFIGSSGQELDRMLREAGIERSECLVTNCFNLQPPGNKIEALCIGKRELPSGYDLPPLQRGKYIHPKYLPELERLRQELLQASPNIIIALGNTAMWATAGLTGIGTYRGTVLPSPLGFKVLPTYHPASVLRQWNQRPIVVADLMKAAREAQFPDIRTDVAEVWVEPGIEDLWAFKSLYINGCELLSFDIETLPSRKLITCIGFAPSGGASLVVPFCDWRSPTGSYWPTPALERGAWAFVREVLDSPIPKVGQNGLYDLQWLWAIAGIPVRNYAHDTMLHHHALLPEFQKDLGFLGSVYTNYPAWKQMRGGKGAKRDD